jgi:hypothetical protein
MNFYSDKIRTDNPKGNEVHAISCTKSQEISGADYITFESGTRDWGSTDMHDTTNNRIKVVRAGIYLVMVFTNRTPANASSYWYLNLYQFNSGGTELYQNTNWQYGAAVEQELHSILIADAAVNDYFRMQAHENHSGNVTATCNMTVIRLGD